MHVPISNQVIKIRHHDIITIQADLDDRYFVTYGKVG